MARQINPRVTWTEYQMLPDDGRRYEVLEGDIVVTPSPDYDHQQAVANLLRLLEDWRRATRIGGCFLTAPFDVILAEDTIVQPDLLYMSDHTKTLLHRGKLHGVPDLVIEVFHTDRAARDRVAKLNIYAKFCVPEYWLVDADSRTIGVLSHDGTTYVTFATGTGDTVIVSKVLPGLSLRPSQVFEGI